jgi:hypothetical protein
MISSAGSEQSLCTAGGEASGFFCTSTTGFWLRNRCRLVALFNGFKTDIASNVSTTVLEVIRIVLEAVDVITMDT